MGRPLEIRRSKSAGTAGTLIKVATALHGPWALYDAAVYLYRSSSSTAAVASNEKHARQKQAVHFGIWPTPRKPAGIRISIQRKKYCSCLYIRACVVRTWYVHTRYQPGFYCYILRSILHLVTWCKVAWSVIMYDK